MARVPYTVVKGDNNTPRVKIDDRLYTPQEISAMILQKMKKRSNFESEEQKKERVKREERIFWEKMTTVLDERKIGTWKGLDKALSKYYSLLVDRQNLIEETGLLNQQNEELKTLLNQYLQAGVNHELHVPPTQVIRLDI